MTGSSSLVVLALMLILSFSFSNVFASEYNSVNGGNDKFMLHKKLDTNNQPVPSHTVTFKTTFDQSSSEPTSLSVSGSVPDVTMNFSDPTNEITKMLDFSGVTFSKPGNYCFKVTESNVSLNTIKPIADSETSYYLWVHVTNGAVDDETGKTNLVIDSYSASNGSDKSAKINYDDHEGLIFENEWDNYNMYVEKKVAGLQADKTKPFTIRLHLRKQSNKPNSSGSLVLKVYGAAGTPKVGNKEVSSTVYETITLNGTASKETELLLKDGDKVFVDGMNDIVEYAVTEPTVAGYTASGTVGTYTPIANNNEITVTVTNTHANGNNPPTGLFINNWPYITVVVIVLAGCIIFVRRRKAKYEYEEDL